MRAKDIGALSGLQNATGISDNLENNPYLTTEDRELAAYYEGISQSHLIGATEGIGESITDEDLESFRTGL